MFTTEFKKEDKSLTINTNNSEFEFDELFDELGNYDIVQANEIKQNYIAFAGMVYEFDDTSINVLRNQGTVSLSYIGQVTNLGDEAFNKWYF